MTLGTKKRGRPANIDQMAADDLDAFLAASSELSVAWAEMIKLRAKFGMAGTHEPRDRAVQRAISAIAGARSAGLSWRQCGEAMGVHHGSAFSWWKRHGTGQVDWAKGGAE